MEKMIPYEKLSRKERRKIDLQRRGSWHGVNPVTRRKESARSYQRQKAQDWRNEAF